MTHHVYVFTFKEGLLSRMAHDLRLHVERVTIIRDGDEIAARFDANSIVVDGTMHDGTLDRNELGTSDRKKIEQTIRNEILFGLKYPHIEFTGKIDIARLRVAGTLSMVGVRRPFALPASRDGDRVRAKFLLRPSDFGIAPFKALAGAIRLQDRVRIELDLDAAPLGLEA
jgi:polyisoprenoid-binding protein YceI